MARQPGGNHNHNRLLQILSTYHKGIVWIGTVVISAFAYANPVPINSSAGISIQQTSNGTVINQSSQRGIINWQSFNIGPNEYTHFQQPTGGATLNRISPQQGVSQIYGKLTATGQIILINPAGIYFGPSAFVNVGGLIATTANLSDENFMQGNYQFIKDSAYAGSGSVVNEGQIIAADHGLVALVAPGVINNGMIKANLGHVVLASGEAFTMNFSGDNLINFTIDSSTSRRGIDKNGNSLSDGVKNTGTLIADGGKILVTAKAAQGVLDNVINMQGVAQARSVGQYKGEIILAGDTKSGVVRVAAKLDASGRGAHQRGGKVTVTGHNILIDSPTSIDVSGDEGGGDIFIGGNAHGAGPLPNANATVVVPNVKLSADAISSGNGGNIILWSDNVTKAYGELSARGGLAGGDGGFIETSSHGFLDISGIHVDVSAPLGKIGTWLLDPWNVTISTSPTSNGSFNGANPDVFDATGTTSNVNTTDLANNLNTANVTITTGSTGSEAGNITVVNPITWTSTNTLLLQAANNIIINAGITGTNGTLELSAVNAAQSITTGAAGTINVKNFNLLQGQWYQVNASLPSFTVSNNFQLNSGAIPNSAVQFIRATVGDGSSGNPFVLTDIYGVQGMGSNSTTLGYSYNLANNIDATVTQNWNSGAGFVPIGTSATPFQGNMNGGGFAVQHLFINLPTTNYVGLFGAVNTNGAGNTIKNIGVTNVNITGQQYTGALIGLDTGVNVDLAYSSGTILGTTIFAADQGGLIGSLSATLSNSYSSASVSGTGAVLGGLVGEVTSTGIVTHSYSTGFVDNPSGETLGGLAGLNSGTINDSYSMGPVYGSFNDGGFVGINTGTINRSYSTGQVTGTIGGSGFVDNSAGAIINSFWDTDTSGKVIGVGGGGGSTTIVTGGCFTGLCTNGGTANLSSQTTYTNAGWTFDASNWGIISNGQSYPYLQTIYPSTPRVITSTTPAAGATTVNLAAGGSVLDTAYTGANGSVYFLERNGSIADNAALLVYLTNGSVFGNVFATAPSGGSSLSGVPSGLSITANAVTVGGVNVSSISNSTIASAIGSLSDSNILLSVSGNNLTINNGTTFTVTTPTTYSVNGDISTSNANMTFNGPVNITSANPNLSTNGGNIFIVGNLNGGGNALTLSTYNTINSNVSGSISNLTALTVNGSGALTLSGNNSSYSGATTVTVNEILSATNNLALGTGTLTVNSGATFSPGNNITLGGLSTINLNGTGASGVGAIWNSGGTQAIGSGVAINLASDSSINVTSGALTIAGTISGNGSLIKTGNNGLTLSAANTYTGSTTISAGTIFDGINNALPINTALSVSTGTLDLNGHSQQVASVAGNGTVTNSSGTAGTFTVNNSSSDTYNGLLTGNLALTKTGAGTLILTNTSNTYTKVTTINAGILSISADSELGTAPGSFTTGQLTFGGGTLEATSIFTLNANRGITLNSDGTILTDPGVTLTYNGIMSGSAGLIKSGTGTLSLGNANTYLGATTLSAGKITLGVNNALPTSTALTDNGTLDLTGHSQQVASVTGSGTVTNTSGTAGTFTINNSGSDTFAGLITGNLALTKSALGTLTLSSANTYTGATTISAGTIANGIANALPTSTDLSVTGTLDLNNFDQQVVTVTGNGTVTNSGLTLHTFTINNGSSDTFAGLLSGNLALVKSNSGLLTLSGSNNYSGTTSINAGTLSAANINALSTNAISLATGATLDISFNNGTFGNSNSLTLNGVGAGNGALTISGANAILNNTITLTGNTSIGGTGSGILNGVIGGAGFSLTKLGAGSIGLGGTNTYSAGTTVNAGTLIAQNNNAFNSAAVIVNSSGTLQIDNNITIGNDLTLNGNGAAGSQGVLVGNGANAIANGAITLGSDSTIGTIGATDVLTLNGTMNGVHALTLQGPGTIVFGNVVGNSSALSSLTANAALDINGGSITTTGTQTYNNPVVLGADTTLTTTNSLVNFASTLDSDVTAARSLTVNAGSGGISLTGDIGMHSFNVLGAMILNTTGATTFGPIIFSANSLTTNAGGTTVINGSIIDTSGDQVYNDPVTLGATSNLTSAAGNVQFSDTLNGNAAALAVVGNYITFDGIVGGSSPLTSLHVTATAGININTSAITTVGTQTYTNAVTLGSDLSLTSSNSLIYLWSTLNRDATAARSLTVNSGSGGITLAGDIGNGVNGALGAMILNTTGTTTLGGTVKAASLTTDTGGTTAVNGSSITTSGNQAYNDAVTLGKTSNLTSNSGNINFANTLNGSFNLTLDGNSGVSFNDIVGGNNALASLDVTGPTNINTTNITTSGNQTYHSLVTLGVDTTVALSGSGTISFLNGINGSKNLTIDGNGASNNFILSGSLALNDITLSAINGSSNNTLQLNNTSNQIWKITNANSGNISGIPTITGNFNFSNIQNLTGGSGSNQFTLEGGTLSGAINGGNGNNNTIIADNVANTWTVTSANAGTVTGIAGGFTNVQNLTGGVSNDEFYLLGGGSLSGNVNGGDGTNTIIAGNVNNTWNISSKNAGTVTGIGGKFSNIQNLTGGNAGNTFIFTNGASVTGLINGGSTTQTNTLNYASYFSPIKISLINSITAGVTDNNTQAIITSFMNINNLVGNYAYNNILDVPTNKSYFIVSTGSKQGYIGDPTYYYGFVVPSNNNTNSNGGTSNSSTNVPVNIPAVIQQGNISQLITVEPTNITTSQNMNVLIEDLISQKTNSCVVKLKEGFEIPEHCSDKKVADNKIMNRMLDN